MNQFITNQLVPDRDRTRVVANHFGIYFPLKLEPTVFNIASSLSGDYTGGFWEFHTLSNGGFFMAPEAGPFDVVCENGYAGTLSPEAFGITACLYAYSQLSFGGDTFAEVCAEHFHWLREFALGHMEAESILAACD